MARGSGATIATQRRGLLAVSKMEPDAMCTENFLLAGSGCIRRKDSEVNAVASPGFLVNNDSTYVQAVSRLDDVVD